VADGNKLVVNLATGLEDAERVTVAFLVAGAALEQGKQVAMFLTKEAVRLGLPGYGEAVACEGCPPIPKLFGQYADAGGELLGSPRETLRRSPERLKRFSRNRLISPEANSNACGRAAASGGLGALSP
jgi:hypothetical protein